MSDEHDEETNSSEPDEESRDEEPGFLADPSGQVEVVETGDEAEGQGQGGGVGGPEQNFGGIFSGGAFRGRETFQLTAPSFWSRPLRILMFVAGILYVGSVLPDVLMGQMSLLLLIGLVGIPLAVGVALAYRAWKIPAEGLEIRFHDGSVEMPKGADNPSFVDVDFHDLRSLVVMARGETELLLLETEKHRFVFSSGDFREPNGPRMLKDEMMRRIQNHPDARAILGRMEELEQRARAASQNPTPMMYALLGMVVAGYVIELTTGALSSQFGLIQLGANAAPLIAEGQWWRLISGNFLHGGFVHIFMNGLALFFLGMYIERLIGSWRFLWIYLVGAVGGSLGSYMWTGAPLSVGASTALYGLFGAFGVLHIRYWKEMPPPYRQTVQWWVVILGLNFAISMAPMIDAAAHFAGMGVGAVATALALIDMPSLNPRKDASVWLKVPTALLTALFAAGLAMASNYAQYEHPGDRTTVYRYMVEKAKQTQSASELNRTAWTVATSGDVTRSQLDIAREAVQEAIAINGETNGQTAARMAYRDTLATIEYRIGLKAREDDRRREQFAEAIRIERQVLRDAATLTPEDGWLPEMNSTGKATYRTRLTRFLSAYFQEFGRYEVGAPPPEGTDLTLESRHESLALRLELPRRVDSTTELIGLVFDENERIGAFQVCVGPDQKGGILERFGPDQWSTGIGADSRVRLALTDTEEPMCPGVGEGTDRTITYWPVSSDVASLP